MRSATTATRFGSRSCAARTTGSARCATPSRRTHRHDQALRPRALRRLLQGPAAAEPARSRMGDAPDRLPPRRRARERTVPPDQPARPDSGHRGRRLHLARRTGDPRLPRGEVRRERTLAPGRGREDMRRGRDVALLCRRADADRLRRQTPRSIRPRSGRRPGTVRRASPVPRARRAPVVRRAGGTGTGCADPGTRPSPTSPASPASCSRRKGGSRACPTPRSAAGRTG